MGEQAFRVRHLAFGGIRTGVDGGVIVVGHGGEGKRNCSLSYISSCD